METLQRGSAAPSLTGAAFLNGQLARFEPGHAYILDFWATWCPPCRTSLPHLIQLQARYPNLTFLALSIERDAQVVRDYLAKEPSLRRLVVAHDPQETAARNWLAAAQIRGIPTTFVINGQGRIAWIGHPMSLEAGISLKSLAQAERVPVPTASASMSFVNLPAHWDFAQGNLVVSLSPDPHPRRASVCTVVKVDGREILGPTNGSPTFSLTRADLAPGRHHFEAVRRDLVTGSEFVTDQGWIVIGSAGMGSPAASTPPSTLSAAQQNVLRLTNAERTKAGLPELRVHPALSRAAQDYATLMAVRGHFSHTGPDGSQPSDRAQRTGYPSRYCGENIAMGQRTAQEVVEGWMRSTGHRENILRPQYQEIGVGQTGCYWVQLFGSRA